MRRTASEVGACSPVAPVCSSLHEQIVLHPKIESKLITVTIDEMYAQSFRMYVRFYVLTNDQGELLQVRQDILFALHDLIKRNEIVICSAQEDIVL